MNPKHLERLKVLIFLSDLYYLKCKILSKPCIINKKNIIRNISYNFHLKDSKSYKSEEEYWNK